MSRERPENKIKTLDEFLELLPQGSVRPVKDHYVYGLVLSTYGVCYIGKGKGDRVFDHFRNLKHIGEHFFAGTVSDRLNTVYHMIMDEMIIRGRSIHHVVKADGLTEDQALGFEQLEIHKFGRLINRTGKLFNLADGGSGIGNGYFNAKHRHQNGIAYQADASFSKRRKEPRGRPSRLERKASQRAFGEHGARS